MEILEELSSELSQCQSIVYKEYNSPDPGSLDVLDEFCAAFLKCCNKLHKVLVFDCHGKYDFIEINFLCLNQIICCIKYLEKAIRLEKSSNTVLLTTRQYFFDRILWCFAKIKSLLNSIEDDVFFTTPMEENNFVDVLDMALEVLAPYCSYEDEKNLNLSTFKSEALSDSNKLRTTVDKVISQALAFANVAEMKDKKIINALCQKALRDCIEFKEECLISNDETTQTTNENNIHLKAVLVENSLYKLEDFINESLLRLIFRVFTDFSQNNIENIRDRITKDPNDESVDDMIADLDINVDRLMQIGMFAITFAPNSQVKTVVRNSLASLESLESYLVPSLYAQCDLQFLILQEHFTEEIMKLKKSLQKIIETDAFAESFLCILSEVSSSPKFDLKQMEDIILMAHLLEEHIELNDSELKLKENHDAHEKYKKFKMMMNECQAVLTCANQIDAGRIVKRFKIMTSCLKKFCASLSGCLNKDKQSEQNVFITSEELAESQKMFESLGISPSVKNVLYQSKRDRKNLTGSLIVQCSRQLEFSTDTDNLDKNSPERKTIKRRVSLRTAMFKRQKNEETQKIHQLYTDNTMNLGLTDILDQLTNLSSSFKEITVADK